MDDYLAGLEKESENVFTLDFGRALELTSSFVLPVGDWWWVYKFVQAAVCSQAHRVELDFQGSCWSMRHDGEPVAETSIMACLEKESAAHFLAVALRNLLKEGAVEVELLTSYEGRARSCRLPSGSGWVELDTLPWGDDEGTGLLCRWGEERALLYRLQEQLQQRVAFAPVSIVLNGYPVNRPTVCLSPHPIRVWPLHDIGKDCLLAQTDTENIWCMPEAQNWSGGDGGMSWGVQPERVRLDGSLEGIPVHGFQVLGGKPGLHQIDFYRFGVRLQTLNCPLEWKVAGLHSCVTAQGLTLDFAGLQVVDNDQWRERLRELESGFRPLYRRSIRQGLA